MAFSVRFGSAMASDLSSGTVRLKSMVAMQASLAIEGILIFFAGFSKPLGVRYDATRDFHTNNLVLCM
jgi:hypothetical protein